MKHSFKLIPMVLLCCLRMTAQERLHIEVTSGVQQENLHWSIAGNSAGQDPNIYSELKWRHIGGYTAGAAIQWEVWRKLVILAEGSRQFTGWGRVTDRDYGGNDRTDAVYDQGFQSRQGYAYTASFGLGYMLRPGVTLELTPYAGYGFSGQSLDITSESVAFLNSHYHTGWRGPFLRAAAVWHPRSRWSVTGRVTWHQVVYRGTADWNLIQTFAHPVSFRHRADGYGIEVGLGLHYRLSSRVALLAAADYFDWQTGRGVDELYLTSGPSQETRLNGVGLDGFNGRIGVTVGF